MVIRLGVTELKKNRVGVPPRLVWRKGVEGMVWFSVCEAPLDDWANSSSVDVFFTYEGNGFSYMGI